MSRNKIIYFFCALTLIFSSCSEDESYSEMLESINWKLVDYEITDVTSNGVSIDAALFNKVVFPDDTVFTYDSLELSFSANRLDMVYAVKLTPPPVSPIINPRYFSTSYTIEEETILPIFFSRGVVGRISRIKIIELSRTRLILEFTEVKSSLLSFSIIEVTQLETFERM